jgi:RNA polymerase sigma factor (sigma-70 family)
MVFGVCRRLLGDHHDAEDAVQAVFLVLARRANAVSPPDAVGNFLYGVAHRTALEARTVARRRATRERTVADMPEPSACDPEFTADLRGVLDAELARLPGKYRALLVACDLEGRPRREVAAALGLCDGTLCSRLSVARAMLGDRLRNRGLAVSAVAALAAAREASAVVPPWVLDSAARIGRGGTGAVPEPAAALASRVLRAMSPAKLFVPAALLVAASVALWATAPAAAENPTPPLILRAAPVPEGKPRDPVLLSWRRGHPAVYASDGKLLRELPNDGFAGKVGSVALSPDGKRMAYSVETEIVRQSPLHSGLYRERVFVRGLDEKGPGSDLGFDGMLAGWSRDGRRVYGSSIDFDRFLKGEANGFENISWAYDLATKTRTVIDVPRSFALMDEADGGRRLLFKEITVDADGKPVCRTYLTAADGGDRTLIVDNGPDHHGAKVSPDGKKVLLACHHMKNGVSAAADPLAVYDVATKTVTVLRIEGLPKFHWVLAGAYQWSPDGKRIVFSWQELHNPALVQKAMLPGVPAPGKLPMGGFLPPPPPDPKKIAPAAPQPKRHPWNVSVVDADGKNMKVIVTDEHHPLDRIDWK